MNPSICTVFPLILLGAYLSQGLHRERLAPGALVHCAEFARRPLHLPLTAPDPHEDAAVEVDGEREQRLDVAAVAVGGRLHRPQHDPERHLVAGPGPEGQGAVLAVARLGRVSAQHSHVGARDADEAAVGGGLGRIHKLSMLH